METVVPWGRLASVVEPHYPKSGRRGRPPIGLDCMLRTFWRWALVNARRF